MTQEARCAQFLRMAEHEMELAARADRRNDDFLLIDQHKSRAKFYRKMADHYASEGAGTDHSRRGNEAENNDSNSQ